MVQNSCVGTALRVDCARSLPERNSTILVIHQNEFACGVFRFVVCVVRVLGFVFSVWSLICGLASCRHQSRRPSSRLCRLVAVALCLCVLCVMLFFGAHTSIWHNKTGLVAHFVGLCAIGYSCLIVTGKILGYGEFTCWKTLPGLNTLKTDRLIALSSFSV